MLASLDGMHRLPAMNLPQNATAAHRTPRINALKASWGQLSWSVALIALAMYVRITPIDIAVADVLFAAEGDVWALRHDPVASGVFHQGGQALMRIAWLGCVAGWAWATIHVPWRHLRRPLGQLALSVFVSVAIVSVLKQLTAVHCPWDLIRYGGSARIGDGGGSCFPSGHASAGYAWLALGFAVPTPRGRRIGVAVAAAAGMLFGTVQQLRGAHFLSHDLWSAAICWAVAVTTAVLWPTEAEGRA